MTDHWDGPSAKDDPVADITDFFAFPIQDGGKLRLVMIMNVHPAAEATSAFDSTVDYNFRLRRVMNIGISAGAFQVQTAPEEFRIQCRSETSSSGTQMRLTAQNLSAAGEPISDPIITQVSIEDISGGSNSKVRLYAGLRADTSFTDLARVRMPVWRDLAFDGMPALNSNDMPGVNSIAKHNVLSIVVVIDVDVILGGLEKETLFAAATETVRRYQENGEMAVHRIDRMGQPEINVWFIQDNELRDLWNSEDTFNLNPENIEHYVSALQSGLSRLDNFEKSLTNESVVDWETPHPMLNALLNDFLIIDVSKSTVPSSTVSGYMEIIQSHFHGVKHKTCGGRVPNEDAIGITLTWFINGPNRPEPYRGSGVSAPDKPVTDEFPYVQPPTLGESTTAATQLMHQHI